MEVKQISRDEEPDLQNYDFVQQLIEMYLDLWQMHHDAFAASRHHCLTLEERADLKDETPQQK